MFLWYNGKFNLNENLDEIEKSKEISWFIGESITQDDIDRSRACAEWTAKMRMLQRSDITYQQFIELTPFVHREFRNPIIN